VSWRQLGTAVLMILLAMDYADPSLPGVFFVSDIAVFYLEGVVDTRVDARPETTALPVLPASRVDRRVALDLPAARLAEPVRPLPISFRPAVVRTAPPSDGPSDDH
jgi:hypothetical protein